MTDHDRALKAIHRGAVVAHVDGLDWLREELMWAYDYFRTNGKTVPPPLSEDALPHCDK